MKSKIAIIVLSLLVLAELVCCFKERQWRKQAEEQAEASATVIAEPETPGAAEVEALAAEADKVKGLDATNELEQLRQTNAVIAKEHTELMDKFVAMSLKLKAAEKELATVKKQLAVISGPVAQP